MIECYPYIALCFFLAMTGASSLGHSQSNVIDGIPPFPLDYDSGSMALHALHSATLPFYPRSIYSYLVGISGAAFKFVYDSTEAYEPLRDASPTDELTLAAHALGFPHAHWVVNKDIETVKRLVRDEVDGGRCVLVPFIYNQAYHGFFVIVGYDYDNSQFVLQGALGEKTYARIPIPHEWYGPTLSPLGWAMNPVFVLGDFVSGHEGNGTSSSEILRLAYDLFKGGRLTYGRHPSERAYIASGDSCEAWYGLPAFEILAQDVERASLVRETCDGSDLNFGFLWRIDSQLGQLAHNRKNGAIFLRMLKGKLMPNAANLVVKIADLFEATSRDAQAVRRFFWDAIPEDHLSESGVKSYVDSSTAIVFALGQDTALAMQLQHGGYKTYKSPWGWVLIADSPEKRMLAKTAVHSAYVHEKLAFTMLERIQGLTVERSTNQPKMPPGRRKHRRRK